MKEYDVVIFGATGFTGQWVVREFNSYATDLKWAIVGRNEGRLERVKTENNLNADILIADISVDETVENVCKNAKLVVNCTGPYRLLGETVVENCVKSGSDYLDLCGEPEFIEAMEMKYNDEAKASGSIVISGCGFDSIPSDLGVNYLKKNFGGELHSVEAFLTMDAPDNYCGHATTWDCAVLGFGNQDALRALRKINKKARPIYKGFSPKSRSIGSSVENVKFVTGRALPFPGSDASIVRRSQYLFEQKNFDVQIKFSMYAMITSISTLIKIGIGGLVLSILSKFSFGQSLLMQYAEIFSFGAFSRSGPPLDAIKKARFCINMVGHGIDENENPKTSNLQVSGPEAGYDATSKILVAAMRTLLDERDVVLDNLEHSGGVTTTAFGFNKTNIIAKLEERGISFEIV